MTKRMNSIHSGTHSDSVCEGSNPSPAAKVKAFKIAINGGLEGFFVAV